MTETSEGMTLAELREENKRCYAASITSDGYERNLQASNARYIPALEAELERLQALQEHNDPADFVSTEPYGDLWSVGVCTIDGDATTVVAMPRRVDADHATNAIRAALATWPGWAP